MSLTDALSNFRAVLEHLASLRAEGGANVEPARVTAAANAGLLLLCTIREEFKRASLSTEAPKDATAAAKAQLDAASLQLHNLLYEKQYYQREVAATRHFASNVSDEVVDLVPLDAFLAAQPPEAAQRLSGDAHELMLARLRGELEGRKALRRQLEAKQASKVEELKKLADETAQLATVKKHIATLAAAIEPLRAALPPPLGAARAIYAATAPAADLLPLPLFIIHGQFAAAAALGGPVGVRLTGDAAAARAAAREEASGAGPAEKRRRVAADGGELSSVHPLSLELSIAAERAGAGAAPLALVFFHYMPALGLVVARGASVLDDRLLSAAFPDDAGSLSGIETVQQLLADAPEGTKIQLPGTAKPYRWAQQLAGGDVVCSVPLPSATSTEVQAAAGEARKQQRATAFVAKLRAAKAAATVSAPPPPGPRLPAAGSGK